MRVRVSLCMHVSLCACMSLHVCIINHLEQVPRLHQLRRDHLLLVLLLPPCPSSASPLRGREHQPPSFREHRRTGREQQGRFGRQVHELGQRGGGAFLGQVLQVLVVDVVGRGEI